MVNHSSSIQTHLLGLVELDQTGTVLYSRLDENNVRKDMSGLNFFSEVAPFNNVEDFRRLIDEFRRGREQANSFEFACHFEDETVAVRVLVARIRERTNGEQTKSVLVHIRRAG
jgi:hypothetical protein